AAQLISGGVNTRIVGPLAVVAGVITELIVVADYPGQLPWLEPLLIVVGALVVITLAAFSSRTVRITAVGVAVAALLAAPSVWAFDTLGHATSGTFPTSAETVGFGGPGGGRGGFGGTGRGGFGPAGASGRFGSGTARPGAGGTNAGAVQLFGAGQTGAPPTGAGGIPGPAGSAAGVPGATTGAGGGLPGGGFAGSAARGAGPGAAGGFGGASQLTSALSYITAHGGGTLAVSSQSTAATAIIDGHTNVAGIGGFSGRESDPSVSWLAQEVRDGKIRWVLDEQSSGFGGNTPGETRVGSKPAMAAVAKACQAVTLSTSASGGTIGGTAKTGTGSSTAVSSGTLYDCQGDAAALAALGTQQSQS
ncbi:MAG: hypothetical protein ABR992_12110, partial [Solirubrobacteraceae bacterium]